jgi:2-polyprenyl-6-methoxyphenol hydroxylase-like FAD-dependent oxidoreductase
METPHSYTGYKRSSMACETTDVIICGCGPTGALLSAYLGKMNISNIVLEKGAEITTDPRGIALDEDGIRLLQGAGLYSSVYTEIGTCKVTPIAINNMRNTVRPLIQTKKAG